MKVFCPGLPKSGTHSFAAMFRAAGFRAGHEPDAENYIRQIFLYFASGDTHRLDEYLLRKGRRFDVEASQLDHFVAARLVVLFPDAKFVLTVRDPRSWLVSLLSHIRFGDTSPMFDMLRELRFRPPGPLESDPREASLRDSGFYPLRGYLSYWSRHIQAVLAAVPPERLLVTEIFDVSAIERFCGLPAGSLSPAHKYRGKEKVDLTVPEEYLNDLIAQHCGDAMRVVRASASIPTFAEGNLWNA